MTTSTHIMEILNNLSPMEVLEVCGLDVDSDALVYALADHICENLEDIEEALIENGQLDEDDV